jgi:hypothetical protein
LFKDNVLYAEERWPTEDMSEQFICVNDAEKKTRGDIKSFSVIENNT